MTKVPYIFALYLNHPRVHSTNTNPLNSLLVLIKNLHSLPNKETHAFLVTAENNTTTAVTLGSIWLKKISEANILYTM